MTLSRFWPAFKKLRAKMWVKIVSKANQLTPFKRKLISSFWFAPSKLFKEN